MIIDHRIINNIFKAGKAAMEQHGPLTPDPVRASLILTEETGEVAKAVLALTRPDVNTDEKRRFRQDELASELSQVAATAIFMMANILLEEELRDTKHK